MGALFLDHNSTTPILPEAIEAMRDYFATAAGNPSSSHQFGRKARQALEEAREAIAGLLDAEAGEVIFTSGATEANNLAILGQCGEPPGLVLASPIEHPCVIEPLRQLQRRGFTLEWLPLSPDGIVITPDGLNARLVAVMLANHETGAIQPVRELVSAFPRGMAFHCDAAQAVGKIPVRFSELGVTSLSASAHKFGGPPGVGVLLVKNGTPLKPLLHGGHQQGGRRPGTEPVALAVGMAAALQCALARQEASRSHLEQLRAALWERLRESAASVVLNGPGIGSSEALPTTLNVSFPGCRSDVLLMSLDLAGVACSTGSACSSGSLLPSPVLAAMGVPDDVLRSAMRFSFAPSTSLEEVEEAARRIAGCVRRVRVSQAFP